jgi:hypothetical protein
MQLFTFIATLLFHGRLHEQQRPAPQAGCAAPVKRFPILFRSRR